ncbi:hypothetical protein BN871_DT_00080 [Paenibacillus sp. P22]|nr:hypothetical protein BN871_DT_00080 [Paenibacillus sp. P22]
MGREADVCQNPCFHRCRPAASVLELHRRGSVPACSRRRDLPGAAERPADAPGEDEPAVGGDRLLHALHACAACTGGRHRLQADRRAHRLLGSRAGHGGGCQPILPAYDRQRQGSVHEHASRCGGAAGEGAGRPDRNADVRRDGLLQVRRPVRLGAARNVHLLHRVHRSRIHVQLQPEYDAQVIPVAVPRGFPGAGRIGAGQSQVFHLRIFAFPAAAQPRHVHHHAARPRHSRNQLFPRHRAADRRRGYPAYSRHRSVLVPWAAYLMMTGQVGTGIGLLVLFLVITVVRRIIEPKILGDSVGIGSISALVSLYVGFKLVGVIGVFIGPLVVIIYMAARKAGLFKLRIRL